MRLIEHEAQPHTPAIQPLVASASLRLLEPHLLRVAGLGDAFVWLEMGGPIGGCCCGCDSETNGMERLSERGRVVVSSRMLPKALPAEGQTKVRFLSVQH